MKVPPWPLALGELVSRADCNANGALVYILSAATKILIAERSSGIRQPMSRKSKIEIAAQRSSCRTEDRTEASPDQRSGRQAARQLIISINGRDVEELPKSRAA
jgi:hypothetical protein